MAFNEPLDIANRCMTHLGHPHISSFSDQSREANEAARVYDGLRLAETADNLWRFCTRRATLRPVGVDSLLWTPPTWASGSSYTAGAVVAHTPQGQGIYEGVSLYWQTDSDVTAGTTQPQNSTNWRRWFGSEAVDLYDSAVTYNAGEMVIVPAAWAIGTTYAKNAVVRSSTTWYVSLQASNVGNAVTDTAYWVAWDSSGRDDGDWGETAGGTDVALTYPGCAFYMSLQPGNEDNPLATGARWLSMAGTGAALGFFYPLATAPTLAVGAANNVYRLPYGYKRMAPSDPKADRRVSGLGMPTGQLPNDWLTEGNYLISSTSGALVIRFVADVIDVPDMADAFCEMLAARMALALFPQLATERASARSIEREYKRLLQSAKRQNAIEVGYQAAEISSLILCRL